MQLLLLLVLEFAQYSVFETFKNRNRLSSWWVDLINEAREEYYQQGA
jgi:hypothetical protein